MINWRTIRIHNQSQNNAFEELVCQFARHNPPNDSKDFNRLGTPDGGVECYWKLNNGKEIGWQAKYVFSVEDLISQIDKSIKTAIKNHPNMNIYIVAAPFNLPDPQYPGKKGKPIKSAKTKWSEKVEYWKQELSTEGNTVEIVLWDESYLNDLLIKPINEGLRYYINTILDFELFNRSKSILKSVDRYIQRKINLKFNLKSYLENNSKKDPYIEAYKDWKISCYNIFLSPDKLFNRLGTSKAIFHFSQSFSFNHTQIYPFLNNKNSKIFDRVMRKFKNGNYSFSLIANVFSKLLFNFLYIKFQKCLCYSLNINNPKHQWHQMPPFIQIVQGQGEILNRVTFINFFDLFNLDLSISGDSDIKWESDIFHDSRTISKSKS